MSARFLGGLLGLLLAGCGGYAALVLSTASWPEAAALRTIYFDWNPRPYTAAELVHLRVILALLAAAGLGLLAVLARPAAVRVLGREVAAAGRGLRGSWRGLRPVQRRHAALGLLALTALRLFYSLHTEPYDDAISFEVFVRGRLLAVAACYPFPNNHILSNTLAWGFYQFYPGFWWSMRLPVLLLSTLGSALWLLGLLRWARWPVVGLAVGVFGVSQLSLYHASSGRGYWLLLNLAALAFMAVLVLARTPAPAGPVAARHDRAAWLALVLAGVLGLYTVPTFAYFLASAYGWLALRQLGRARSTARRALGTLLGAGGLTLLGAGLLYTPLLLVSGPALLFSNTYLLPLPVRAFWAQLPAYWWTTEGFLAGQRLVGAGGTVAVLGGYAWLWRRARAGGLPAGLGPPVRGLGLVALWFVLLPYAVIAVQRVQAPERTLFYKAQLLFVLAGLVWDWLRRQLPPKVAGWGLALLAGFYLAGELAQLERNNDLRLRGWAPARLGAAWLATQPPGPLLVPDPAHRMLLGFYVHARPLPGPWRLDATARPGVRYRYRVVRPGPLPETPPPAFRAGDLLIFVLPPPARQP